MYKELYRTPLNELSRTQNHYDIELGINVPLVIRSCFFYKYTALPMSDEQPPHFSWTFLLGNNIRFTYDFSRFIIR